jgi:Cu2+-exporting ATPase
MRPHAHCHHCGEPVTTDPILQATSSEMRVYCCHGCAAAARWIEDSALGDYYRFRTASAARVGNDRAEFSAWDRPAILDQHSREVDGGREITLLTDGMRCAACAWLIDRALRREDGVLDASANAITGRIRIVWNPQVTLLSPLLSRLAALGYRPFLATGAQREQARRRERRRWLLRLGIAGLGAMQAMMFAEALYLDVDHQMPTATRDFFRWITFLVTTPVVFYAGWPFIEGMWREWRGHRVGMDTLVAGSALLAYFASLSETVRGGAEVWYDATAMFVFLLLTARMLEQRVRGIASAQVDALARAQPALVVRESLDGKNEQVPVDELRVGDVVRIADGEAVPADGTLLQDGAFDEALLTGESTIVPKLVDALAYAGSVCRGRIARLRVTRIGSDTRLSELARLVERAQSERPRLARIADRIASGFVAMLLLAAVAVYAWWRNHDPSRALEISLAVLVVSCPCALSLAVPAVLASVHGALAKLGVLSLREDALNALARVEVIVFDKTGTLGDGRPQLETVETFDGIERERALQIAAALERDSTHPLAHAFADVDTRLSAQEVRSVPGQGLQGDIDGIVWKLGRADFAANRQDDDALWLGDGQQAFARFILRECVRADARTTVQALSAQGLRVEICSGDAQTRVAHFARTLGIADARARQSPEDKLAHVRSLQAQGQVVAMVGDGLNDAPVLAGADVSLAFADGAALAHRAADFVITGPTLHRIPQAVALARASRRVIRQNLAWAIGYNLLALPLAASGHVSPWLAALGMASSSLLVTLNSLRLTRKRE